MLIPCNQNHFNSSPFLLTHLRKKHGDTFRMPWIPWNTQLMVLTTCVASQIQKLTRTTCLSFYWSIFQAIKSVWISWESKYTLVVTIASHKEKQIIKIKWYFIKINEGGKQPECSSRWILEGLKMRSEKVYSPQQEYSKYISKTQWKCLFKIEPKKKLLQYKYFTIVL